ncbi:MAG TPA: chorismate mutase [Rickettsiales bacterium]|nr:chorismate mutase [Rickettsiales bacterium]
MTLEELRIKVNECNKELFQVLKKRFDVTREIGELKAKTNLPACDKKRQEEILEKVKKEAKMFSLNGDMVEKIFKTIMKQVVKEHKEIRNANRKNK